MNKLHLFSQKMELHKKKWKKHSRCENKWRLWKLWTGSDSAEMESDDLELWLVYCAFGTYVVSLLCNGANPNRGLSCQNETQLQTVEEEKKRSAQKDREREKEREGEGLWSPIRLCNQAEAQPSTHKQPWHTITSRPPPCTPLILCRWLVCVCEKHNSFHRANTITQLHKGLTQKVHLKLFKRD